MAALTVLIASSPYEGEMIRRAIDAGGLRAVVADGVESALELLVTESPSVVVIAAGLFDGAGWKLVDGLRKPGGRVPMILIDDADGAHTDDEDSSGAEAVLLRPIDPSQLVEIVSRLGGVLSIEIPAEPPPPVPALASLDDDDAPTRSWLFEGGDHGILRVDDSVDDFAHTIPSQLRQNAPRVPLHRADRDVTLPGLDRELGLPEPKTVITEPPVVEAPPHAPPLDTGDLAVAGPPELFARLHREGFTGRLVLRRGEAEKTILFQSGRIAAASSNLPHDQLADVLLRDRRVPRSEHGRWRTTLNASGAEGLVGAGLLGGDEVAGAWQRQSREIILSCFAWERGTFELRPGALRSGDEKLDVHPFQLALEGIRRHFLPDRLFELVGPPSTEIAPLPALQSIAEAAGLDENERRAVARLAEGTVTISELAADGALSDAMAYALGWALLSLGGATRTKGLDRARVLGKWAQVADGDYFSLLELASDAAPDAITPAWKRLRDEFARARCPASLRDELGDHLDEIELCLDEARRILADDRIREAYRAHLRAS